MTRTASHAILMLLGSIAISTGCNELEGRTGNRKGNAAFREMKFVDAVGEYEASLKKIDEPIVHYNLGLAYSKVFKPGLDGPVLLGVAGDVVCTRIPNVKMVSSQVCVKAGDRTFNECDDKNVCPSSFQCQKVELCTLTSAELADNAAQHWQKWLAANPKDDDTRKQMTQVWIDSEQFDKGIAFWDEQLKARPDDVDAMGILAGINLKAGDWRKSIEWYTRVADKSPDDTAKVAAYQFIGNVAWSKLNSKTLSGDESLELADKGIGALQAASKLQPNNGKLFSLQGAIMNFRSVQQGASIASAVDRAYAQDLLAVARVLNAKAKAAAGGATPETPPAEKPPTPAPAPGSGAGSSSAGTAPSAPPAGG
jgi:tetratricopeptide (TPR) repeat protein